MPRLELTDQELIVHLGKWERMMALTSDIRVQIAQVKSARKDCRFGALAA